MLRFLNQDDKAVGTLDVRDGHAVATGAGREAVDLHVVEPGTLRRLTPADGAAWLDAVRYVYRSPYLRAVLAEQEAPRLTAGATRE